MDPIKKELEGLESRGNLAKAIQDVQSITNILSHARDSLHTSKLILMFAPAASDQYR